jgi:HAD superfamily hydrolase (TIGR01509 family)
VSGRLQAGGMGPRAIFFDLDYTLYDQWQHVAGALAQVAAAVAQESPGGGRALADSLVKAWGTLGPDHEHLFDRWLEGHGLLSRERVEKCVRVFHAYRPAELVPYLGVEEVLQALKSRQRLGIITDGEPHMQRAKVTALGLAACFDVIVYAGELSRAKPDPEVFQRALQALEVRPEASVFVGDHPVRDILGARRVGMRALRVLTGEFRQLPDDPRWGPEHRLESLRDLPAVLDF